MTDDGDQGDERPSPRWMETCRKGPGEVRLRHQCGWGQQQENRRGGRGRSSAKSETPRRRGVIGPNFELADTRSRGPRKRRLVKSPPHEGRRDGLIGDEKMQNGGRMIFMDPITPRNGLRELRIRDQTERHEQGECTQ
ncbi:MAG TPA: hypothetical protein VMU17_07885 [Elusimicrobiota bacterium]|nr:hypothetical protein [Elusimicrobiota bacterium]